MPERKPRRGEVLPGEAWPAGLDPEALLPEEEELIARFATEVVQRRMSAAAIFFFESLRPMNFILSQGMLFFSPLMQLLLRGSTFDRVQALLEKRAALPAIVEGIERLEEERRDHTKPQG
jgi:hypothetical protein